MTRDLYNEAFWSLCEQMIEFHGITIDRERGSRHPKYPDLIYPLDYGYIKGTKSMDKEGIDIWIGSKNEKDVTGCIVTIDSIKNDCEIKLLYSCTDEEVEQVIQLHNRSPFMKGILIRR